MQSKLGLELCRQMLFLDAFTRLDTTSRIFHIETSNGNQKLQKTDAMKFVAGNSTTKNMNPSDIFESDALFFGGKDKPTLSFFKIQHTCVES